MSPRPGVSVCLTTAPGVWYVWSRAPRPGTWFLLPLDGPAVESLVRGQSYVEAHTSTMTPAMTA